ncbi:MAG: hypothetical protein IKV73_04370, partial [Clostridia bacterium]|nr:hypothetical protein [Clostridia bacterium]
YTYVFNFMTDNYLSPSVYAASTTFVNFDANGYLNYLAGTSSSNSMKTTSYKIEKNKWHQLAITIDCDRKRPLIFLDGKYIGCDDAYLATMDKVAICISKTQVGKVYYDDVVYYEGYYRNDDEVVTPSKEISNIAIDTYNDIISYANVTGVADLKAAIKEQSNAATVEIYNSDYTVATELTNDKIVVLTSPNGLRYEYYTLANLDVSDIVFDVADDNIKASVAMFKSAASPVLYLAAYSDSELISIDVATVTVGGDIAEATVAYDKDLTYKAFVWDGVSPVAKDEY